MKFVYGVLIATAMGLWGCEQAAREAEQAESAAMEESQSLYQATKDRTKALYEEALDGNAYQEPTPETTRI